MTKMELKTARNESKEVVKKLIDKAKDDQYDWDWWRLMNEIKAVLLSLNSIAKKSGWKLKTDPVEISVYGGMKLERDKETAKVSVSLSEHEQTVSITVTHKISLTDPKSIDKFHRIMKGTRKVNPKK